jgi:hypothetical protein
VLRYELDAVLALDEHADAFERPQLGAKPMIGRLVCRDPILNHGVIHVVQQMGAIPVWVER